MKKHLLFLAITLTAFACNNETKTVTKTAPSADDNQAVTLAGVEPRLQEFDSLAALIYKDPFGGEAERYTRYYRLKALTDSSNLAIVNNQLKEPFVKSDTLRECRSEGKIHVFDDGKIKQTIYFATEPQACRHVYIIHEGFYYYMPMQPAFDSAFRQWKTTAIELKDEGAL